MAEIDNKGNEKKPFLIKLKFKAPIPEYRQNAINSFKDLKYLTQEQITKLELSIYNYTDKFCLNKNIKNNSPLYIKIYTDKFIHILSNINKESYIKNEYLYNKIIKNEINIEEIINLEPRYLAPNKWEFFNKIEETTVCSILQGNSTLHKSKLYKCSRCKNNDTEYTESQTRSADEPTTFFITCRVCGKKWTQ
jgi:DNA-directed RNA polymerase subunit M/transcription elongation factor TFIIS